MKKILFILALTLGFIAQAQEINWVTLEEAVALQKKNPKKIMMDVYTKWCGPCKALDRNTFHNKDVVKYVNKNYYAVKFNAEGNEEINFKDHLYTNPNYDPAKAKRRNSAHELSRAFNVSSYPTILFLDEKSDLIAPIIGYKVPKELELYLKMFKRNDHVALTSQEEFVKYYESFKHSFK